MRKGIAVTFFHEFKGSNLRHRLQKTSASLFGALPRTSTFPFLSSDFFRLLATDVFENGEWKSSIDRRARIAFVAAEEAREPDFVDSLGKVVRDKLGKNFSAILIHDGDVASKPSDLVPMLSHANYVYSVNLVVESERVKALPIGLENAYRNMNGSPDLFISNFFQSLPTQKTMRVMASFRVRTNPKVRSRVREMFLDSEYGFLPPNLTPKEHFAALSQSQFVISPPGNGPDCHRTWEAIALGAIPVVLDGTLAPSFCESLPIMCVRDYSDFLELSRGELDSAYKEIISKNSSMAFAPYWTSKFFEPASS